MVVAITVLHIAAAAAWFGHKLLIPRDLRASLHQEEPADIMIARMHRAERLGIGSGIATLGTGLWLMHLTTGLTSAPLETYLALGAVLAMFAVGAVVARPAWNRVKEALQQHDLPDAVAAAGGFGRAVNLESLLWILALSAMVV